MNSLIVWILLGELVLVSLVGIAIAIVVGKVRENRLMTALGGMISDMRGSEADRREELQYLCNELFRLPTPDTAALVDTLLEQEKQHIGVLARTLLERDMDGLGRFHEQVADLSTAQIKKAGEALREAKMAKYFAADEKAEAADDEANATEPGSDGDEVVADTDATAEAADEGVPPVSSAMLTPEELEKEIWGELEKVHEDAPVLTDKIESDAEVVTEDTSEPPADRSSTAEVEERPAPVAEPTQEGEVDALDAIVPAAEAEATNQEPNAMEAENALPSQTNESDDVDAMISSLLGNQADDSESVAEESVASTTEPTASAQTGVNSDDNTELAALLDGEPAPPSNEAARNGKKKQKKRKRSAPGGDQENAAEAGN